MIEVEIDIDLRSADIDKLLQTAEFVKAYENRDLYFDDEEYSLTLKDWWLRKRNGKYQLKIPRKEMGPRMERDMDMYDELETDAEIKTALDCQADDVEECMSERGIEQISDIIFKREKYKLDEFIITVDETNFGETFAEVEILVPDNEKPDKAKQKILDLMDKYGFEQRIEGKMITYLRKYRPEHYQALVGERG